MPLLPSRVQMSLCFQVFRAVGCEQQAAHGPNHCGLAYSVWSMDDIQAAVEGEQIREGMAGKAGCTKERERSELMLFPLYRSPSVCTTIACNSRMPACLARFAASSKLRPELSSLLYAELLQLSSS